jgi:hypothetical protein
MLLVLAPQVITVPQGSILGPLLFLIFVNDLPMITDSDSIVVFFAEDTSIIITRPNQDGLKIALNKTLPEIVSWFKANFLSFNFNKMYYLQFQTKNYIDNTLDTNYLNKTIANVPYTKYLGLVVDDTVNLGSIKFQIELCMLCSKSC